MSPTGISALRALALVCLVLCTSAGGKLCGQLFQTQLLDGVNFQETNVLNIAYTVPTERFDTLISIFNSEETINDNYLAGFIFVPNRKWHIAPLDSDPFGRLPVANGRFNPQGDNFGGFRDLSDSVAFITTQGYRVFLAYWIESEESEEERAMGYMGFSSMEEIMALEIPENDSFFVIDGAELGTLEAFPLNDENSMADITEFNLAYLPIDDYEYVARGESYYPGEQLSELGGSENFDRSLIIQRAVAGQAFNLVSGDVDAFKRYRTLSIRPFPKPFWGENREAGIAFKLTYYCPPFWDEDDDPNSLGSLLQQYARPQTNRSQNTGRPSRDSTNVTELVVAASNSIDTINPKRLEIALNNVGRQHLEQAEYTFETMGSMPGIGKRESSLLDNLWWIILVLIAFLVAGYAVGFNKGKTSSATQTQPIQNDKRETD
ncbi:MAG: hypothetical protein AAF741_16315 [Bacteroidota bacterium]